MNNAKTAGYSNKTSRARRDKRRAEAKARQAAYDGLTVDEKIALLPPTGARKQRAKLEALRS